MELVRRNLGKGYNFALFLSFSISTQSWPQDNELDVCLTWSTPALCFYESSTNNGVIESTEHIRDVLLTLNQMLLGYHQAFLYIIFH